MHDEWEAEESTDEEFRRGVATASMDVMEAIQDGASEKIVAFHTKAVELIEALVAGGLDLPHAGQIVVSFAAGAAIDLAVDAQ